MARALVGIVIAAAIPAFACVASVDTPPARAVYVAGPPPQPLPEASSSPGVPGLARVEGYWHWTGVHYVWIPTHWESHPGETWVAPTYESVDGRWVYRPGRWEKQR